MGAMRVANALWLFSVSKIYEFLDTVFMVLRKRNRQINLLHVYHHASIAYVWLAVNTRYFPGGDSWWAASLNSLVHVVMYAYYLMATLKIPCFFKKYITMFQILQFVPLSHRAPTASSGPPTTPTLPWHSTSATLPRSLPSLSASTVLLTRKSRLKRTTYT